MTAKIVPSINMATRTLLIGMEQVGARMEDLGFKLKSEAVKLLFCEREFKVPFSKPNWNWTINTEPNHFLPRAQLHDH